MKLPDKLIMLRKENGWSQEDFAEKLEVSRQAVSRWENATALPDSQNLLRISRLFHVSADYLLDDDRDDRADISADGSATKQAVPPARKKRFPYVCAALALCLAILLVGMIVNSARDTEQGHTHPVLNRVVENEVGATCTEQGSYDEVFYCAECGREVLRTHITTGMPAHQFENEKCIICGEDQRARD